MSDYDVVVVGAGNAALSAAMAGNAMAVASIGMSMFFILFLNVGLAG